MKNFHELARSYCNRATNGVKGRRRGDSIVTEVTEGRDVPSAGPYSSCGDLCHGMLYHLGVRLPWVNRDENGGWRTGQNIALLFPTPWRPPPKKLYENFHPDGTGYCASDLACGDILYMFRIRSDGYFVREHVCVFDRLEEGKMCTWDYGQPGGKYYKRINETGIVEDGRMVHCVLPLSIVIDTADECGKLVV